MATCSRVWAEHREVTLGSTLSVAKPTSSMAPTLRVAVLRLDGRAPSPAAPVGLDELMEDAPKEGEADGASTAAVAGSTATLAGSPSGLEASSSSPAPSANQA